MPGSLKRVLRIRSIQEDLARADLEHQTSRLLAIESTCDRAAADIQRSRNDSFVIIAAADYLERATAAWIEEEANWQRAVRCRKQAEEERHQQRVNSELATAEFIVRRRDRQQASALFEATEASRRSSNDRLEQRILDDWYQSRYFVRGKATSVSLKLGKIADGS